MCNMVTVKIPTAKLLHYTTGHEALKWLLTTADDTGRLARWRLRILKFHFEVVHRAGITYQASDKLSGLRTECSDKTSNDDRLPLLMIKETKEQEYVKTE